MAFGERLRELREERNITQKALAEVLGVSPRMVSFYESGAHFLSDEYQLCRLADYFGVSTDYLLGRTSTRTVGQIEKLEKLFALLPDDDCKSIMDYSDYLLFRYQKIKRHS